jgi:hypothetical protein
VCREKVGPVLIIRQGGYGTLELGGQKAGLSAVEASIPLSLRMPMDSAANLANGESITRWRDHPVQVLLSRLRSHRRPEIGLPRHLRAAYADHGEQNSKLSRDGISMFLFRDIKAEIVPQRYIINVSFRDIKAESVPQRNIISAGGCVLTCSTS